MTVSIPRFAVAGFVALAVVAAACGNPDPGVEAGRSDRTRAEVESAATVAGEVSDTTTSTAAPATTEPPATAPVATEPATTEPTTTDASPPTSSAETTPPERPPAPAASGLGSVSADDLDSVFLPSNPSLLGPSLELTDARDPQTFLDEDMTFSGMDPVIEVAGAPITLATYFVNDPTFADSGEVTAASRFRARYRMAVEVENDDIDGFAIALRDELRPIVEAANPGEEVIDTLGTAALGNSIHGLRVGPEDNPSTLITIDQHYVVVPRLVNDLLLAVNVTRFVGGEALIPAELPSRDRFVNGEFDAQLDLFGAVPAPSGAPALTGHRLVLNIPSAGTPTTFRSASYDVAVPADGFEEYVDSFASVVEADEYEGVENFGDVRSFDHVEERVEREFVLDREGEIVTVLIQGDITAYPG